MSELVRWWVFDIGGVIAPDLGEYLFEEVARRYGLDRELAQSVFRALWKTYAHQPATDQEHADQLEHRFWEDAAMLLGIRSIEQFILAMIDLTPQFIGALPGMLELLAECREQELPLAVLSNQTAFWKNRLVDQLELKRFFNPQQMVFSCDARASKSSPGHEMFHSLHSTLGQPPRGTMVLLDDRAHNLQQAIEFGCGAGILVPPLPDFIATYLRNLLRLIYPRPPRNSLDEPQ